MKLKEMTDEQLKNEYISYWETINVVECYGTRDLMWIDSVERELRRRGFEIYQGLPEIKKVYVGECDHCGSIIDDENESPQPLVCDGCYRELKQTEGEE
jgi:hypothetical protein